MSEKKQSYAELISCIADDFLGFISEYYPNECERYVDEVADTVKSLLVIEKPKVMVYMVSTTAERARLSMHL